MYDALQFLPPSDSTISSKHQIRQEKLGFLNAMKTIGFELRLGIVKLNKKGKYVQWGVDSKMIRDIIRLAKQDRYDRAIIVSGDHHILPAINNAQVADKTIEIYAFRRFVHRKIIKTVGRSYVHYFEDLLPHMHNPYEPSSDAHHLVVHYRRLAKFMLIKEKLLSRSKKRHKKEE